jgi:ABC-type sugar transport system substrate-binding protein
MKRRDLLTLAAAAAGAWSVAALAQQAKMPTIGVLVIAIPGSEKFWQ